MVKQVEASKVDRVDRKSQGLASNKITVSQLNELLEESERIDDDTDDGESHYISSSSMSDLAVGNYRQRKSLKLQNEAAESASKADGGDYFAQKSISQLLAMKFPRNQFTINLPSLKAAEKAERKAEKQRE